MLMKKIPRHVQYSANKPPSDGPTTALIPQTLARYPWTLPRSAGE